MSGHRGGDFAAFRFRLLAPSQVFPISYWRGRAAHLDVGGLRGQAIRRALQDQLGLVVEEVELPGWPGRPAPPRYASRSPATRRRSCSASCTPAATCAPTAGTSWAASCCMAGWRTKSRSTPSAGWSNKRTTRSTSCIWPGCPPQRPYGVVELTLEREYLLVTEFFAGATELGDAEVDDQVIDDGLGIIRKARMPAWPTATSSRPTCWSATAGCC